MNSKINLTSKERWLLSLPGLITAGLLNIFLFVSAFVLFEDHDQQIFMLKLALATLVFIISLAFLLTPFAERSPYLLWFFSLINGLFIGLFIFTNPFDNNLIPRIFSVIAVTLSVIIGGRWPTYLLALVAVILNSILAYRQGTAFINIFANNVGMFITASVITETILGFQKVILMQMKRLETVNNVSRSLASSLEIHQVISLVSAAIQNALPADTYYVGLLQQGRLRLELFYDDGEFFPTIELPIENTLAGWVIRNEKSLRLQNIEKEYQKFGLTRFVIGKQKNSVSWMGTPLLASGNILGMVAVASYEKSAFDPHDLELIENVAKQAAMAIDNAYHHAEVELQSKLDSLTGAYNHGYFLKLLENEADKANKLLYPLSLIMLDIDHFKLYNDRYGHMVGDQVLITITQTIRNHIKMSDSVGRWGGEEFVIMLPAVDGETAIQIAERIRISLSTIVVHNRDGELIPPPTISQGIAVLPSEVSDYNKLIDLADQRLFIAKDRGRDQIEPQNSTWSKNQSGSD